MPARAEAPCSSGTSTVIVTRPTLSRVVHGPGPSLEDMRVRWRAPGTGVAVSGALLAVVTLATGCARFSDEPKEWHPQDQLTPQAAPNPELPGDEGAAGGESRPEQPEPSEVPPPNGCKDYNPAVIGTCMSTVVAVAALPGDGREPSALVGERDTGRILRVKRGADPQV